MRRFFSQIIGNPVVSRETGELIARVTDVIIHPDTGKIEGLWVIPLTLPIPNGVIQSGSIVEWKKNIYIKDDREIAEPEDIMKIAEILSRETFFVGNRLVNELAEVVGRVYDVDFDTEKLYLNNLYSKKSFLGFKYDVRTFSYDSVIEAFPDYILVKDVEEKKEKIGERETPLLDT